MTTPSTYEALTDFGYQQVSPQEKTARVHAVFDTVASKYDIMNDVMSLGLHRLWKRYAVYSTPICPGQTILDLAGGTGDLSRLIAPKLKGQGKLIITDINYAMLTQGRDRLLNQGFAHIQYVVGNAEALPFPDNYFDHLFIAFGLRNVTDKITALRSMYRVLRPAGRLIILEFSHPYSFLQAAYDHYSFNLIPNLGEWITHDRESYQYLVESIRMHPSQSDLARMLTETGFFNVQFENLSGGIVALHTGYKV